MAASFKKRGNRRNIREKKEWKDEEEDGGGTEDRKQSLGVTKPSGVGPAGRPPLQQKGVLLSFGDEIEEGTEEFKIKKSSLSKKLNKEREAEERKQKEQKLIKEALRDDSDDDRGGGGGEGGEESVLFRLQAGVVPDASMIHAIRKKRQLVREKGGGGGSAQEYIPLDGRKKNYKAASGKSRLIREDEHDKSDEDDEDDAPSRHMTFGKKAEPARQLQVLSALENLESGSEDEETQRWEEEQINKGIKASNPPPPSEELTINSLDPLTQSFIYGRLPHEYHNEYYRGEEFNAKAPPPLPVPTNLVPITIESLKSRLSTQLQEMKDDLHNHEMQLQQVQVDLKEATLFIERAETGYPSLEKQYLFYQQMRGYLRDLLSCLAVKAPIIKSLESKLHDIQSQKSQLLITRRRQDVKDQSEECRGGGGGGGGGEGRKARGVEREARRRRRREKRERQGVSDHNEGMSSDEELLETDRLKFVTELDTLHKEVKDVFSDVVGDFCDLNIIKTRFEQWKFTEPNSYQQAYVSECLVKVLSPFIRYETIRWNPLQSNTTSIDTMNWFISLLSYCYDEEKEEETGGPDPNDTDTHLIPQVIDKVIITKLTDIVQRVWDPLSSSQTQCLINNIQYIREEFPTVSPQTKNFLELQTALVKRLQEALAEDTFIPLMTRGQLESTNTVSYHFYQRQFWKCMKLLVNMLACQWILPNELIQQLVLDGLVSRHILLSLQNSPLNELTITKLTTLLHQLPKSWYQLENNKTLQSVKRYLSHLMETLGTQEMSYSNEQLKKSTRQLKVKLLTLQTLFSH